MVAFHDTALVVAAPDADEAMTDRWAAVLADQHTAVSVLHPGWVLVRLTVLAGSPEEAAELSRAQLRRTTDREPYVLCSTSERALKHSLRLLGPLAGDDLVTLTDRERSAGH